LASSPVIGTTVGDGQALGGVNGEGDGVRGHTTSGRTKVSHHGPVFHGNQEARVGIGGLRAAVIAEVVRAGIRAQSGERGGGGATSAGDGHITIGILGIEGLSRRIVAVPKGHQVRILNEIGVSLANSIEIARLITTIVLTFGGRSVRIVVG